MTTRILSEKVEMQLGCYSSNSLVTVGYHIRKSDTNLLLYILLTLLVNKNDRLGIAIIEVQYGLHALPILCLRFYHVKDLPRSKLYNNVKATLHTNMPYFLVYFILTHFLYFSLLSTELDIQYI